MPIKNAFKRSLLNCQPIMSASSKVVSTAFDKTDGYAGVATGFANLIERQNGLNPRTTDSITLAGVSDFEGSQNFSVDPQRPEVILISKLFEGDKNVNEKLLNLRDFESSIDEADIKTIFDDIISNENLKKALDKRLEIDQNNRDEANKILDSLSRLALNVDNFRDSIDFIGSNKNIHTLAASNRSKISSRYSEDPKGSSMSYKRTFLGLNDLSSVSNTSLLQILFLSLLLPGNVKFSTQRISAGIQGKKFLLPSVQYDSTSDFLQFLATKDITDSEDFFDIESRLPKDPYSKLSMLSDALSYELVTTVGLKKIERDSVFEILQNNLNPISDIIRTRSVDGTITSTLAIDDTLPFEIRKNIIDGITYNGALEKFIDPVISNASLDFEGLNSFSSDVSSIFGSYINVIEKIRGVDQYEDLQGSNLIASACDYILRGSKSILENTRVSTSNLQLALFVEISKNNTSHGIRSRFDLFDKILTDTAVGVPGIDRPRPRSNAQAKSAIGNSSILYNSKIFKDFLNVPSNSRPTSSQSRSGSSTGSKVKDLINTAKNIFGKKTKTTASSNSTSRTANPIVSKVKPQIMTATNLASNVRDNKIIKNEKFSRKTVIENTKKEIKNENIPEKRFVRETIKSVLGSLALTPQQNIFSTSKNSQYNEVDDVDSDVFDIKESKIEAAGTSYATLQKFELTLQDIYKRKVEKIDANNKNPISSIKEVTAVKKKNDKNKINRVNLLTLGALPIQRKRSSDLKKIPIQSASKFSSVVSISTPVKKAEDINLIGLDSQKKKNIQIKNEKKRSEKITVSKKTAEATSTLFSNVKSNTSTKMNKLTASPGILYGTSLKQNNVKEHFRLVSAAAARKPKISSISNLKQFDVRTLDKIDTIDELLDLVESVKLIEQTRQSKTQRNTNLNTRRINLDFSSSRKKSASLSESASSSNSVDKKYVNFFNCLADGTNDQINFLTQNSDIEAVLKQIKFKNTISEQVNIFYNFISSRIDSYVGSAEVLDGYTSNYELDETKIKFIIFEIFTSILSMIQSIRMVRINSTRNVSTGFKVQSRVTPEALDMELKSLSTVANSSGTSSDVVLSGAITTNLSRIIKAMSYCSISNDLLTERFSVAKSFLDIYTTSVNSLISASTSQEIKDTLSILISQNNTELLKNLTQEYISSKQLLYTKTFDEGLSIKSTTRLTRIASNILTGLIDDKNDDVDVLSVGLPVKTVEILRRIDSPSNTNMNLTGKEYIELEFTKRNVQFPDIIAKSSKFRFSPRLEVVPQFTSTSNLMGQAEDFIYLCHESGEWTSKNFAEAVIFIGNITGLQYVESITLVLNHIMDAVCKLTFNVTTGFSFDEFMTFKNSNEISKQGYDFYKSLLLDRNVFSSLPIGDMNNEEYFERLIDGSYKLKQFSDLGFDNIDKTDQSTHRLLTLFLSDSIFNTEKQLKNLIKTGAFERVYCCLLNQEDYIFDKISSYSTKSGRTTVNGLLRKNIAFQTADEIKFVDDNFTDRLDADEISVKINLVSN